MEAKTNDCVSELNEMLNVVVVPEMSEIHEQCIYKVPPRIRQTNPQAYTPQIISIGPFHNPYDSGSDNILHQMEQLKLKYLKGFLKRTKLSLDDLVFKFKEWENKIRYCYAEIFSFNSNDFIKIFIIDACFIIEYFLRYIENSNENDPITPNPSLQMDIFLDLLLLENQIPFFVLEDIYKLAGPNPEFPSFLTVAIYNFRSYTPGLSCQESGIVQCPKHFTDLLRTFLLPPSDENTMSDKFVMTTIDHVYSVSQLTEAGLVFKDSLGKCLLDLNFDEGVFQMPCIFAHHTTERYLKNMLAFEECHISDINSRYVCQYIIMLDFLTKTEKDVSILVDKGIIINMMRDANEVATMVNNLCKNITFRGLAANSLSVCQRLNDFYKNSMTKYKVSFLQEYFSTPWKTASSVAALLLLLLTLIQTVCSIRSL